MTKTAHEIRKELAAKNSEARAPKGTEGGREGGTTVRKNGPR